MPASKTQAAMTAARRTEALRMRHRGQTWQQIAEALGYSGPNAAQKDAVRALDAHRAELAETVDQHRTLALERLDAATRATFQVLDRFHVTVSAGKIVTDEDGVPLRDDGPVLDAVRTLLGIEQRRARLLGLDPPAEARVNGQVVNYVIEGVDPADLK